MHFGYIFIPKYLSVCLYDNAVYVYQIFFHNLLSVWRGEGRTPRGGAAPLSPHIVTYHSLLISYTQHTPSCCKEYSSAFSLVSNCATTSGFLSGSQM